MCFKYYDRSPVHRNILDHWTSKNICTTIVRTVVSLSQKMWKENVKEANRLDIKFQSEERLNQQTVKIMNCLQSSNQLQHLGVDPQSLGHTKSQHWFLNPTNDSSTWTVRILRHNKNRTDPVSDPHFRDLYGSCTSSRTIKIDSWMRAIPIDPII